MAEVPVCFDDIFVGMKLKDDEGHNCVVKKIFSEHNVIVEYTWGTVGGYGFICLDPSSDRNAILYKF